jgi:cellulose biosynthesis protein BcsQ
MRENAADVIDTLACLVAAGKRLLVIGVDFNKQAAFYYLSSNQARPPGKTSPATVAGLRSINKKRLSRMTPALAWKYDLALVDCQPDCNNLTLNAINVSNIIITPAIKDLDDFYAGAFLWRKIALDTDKQDNWYITINGYNRRYE